MVNQGDNVVVNEKEMVVVAVLEAEGANGEMVKNVIYAPAV